MPFPKFFFYSLDHSLTSESPAKKEIDNPPVGANIASDDIDPYYYHENILKWIEETKHKLPRGNPKLRKEAFLADPLVKGTIFPYKLNTLLKDFNIETVDNKLYSEAITEIKDYLVLIKLMKTFRDSFLDLHFLVGRTYHRMDFDANNNIIHLERIEPNSTETYTDAWDSTIVAYHQHSNVSNIWTKYGTLITIDSWFIPFTGAIKNIKDTYIDGRPFGNSAAVLMIFNSFKEAYKISDVSNLRVAASERIIAMKQQIDLKLPIDDNEYYNYNNSHSPIDSILVPIFLKKLLLERSNNLIDAVLSPFLQATMGRIEIGRDAQGNPKIVSTNPDRPTSLDPDYAAKMQKYNDFIKYFQDLSKNLIKSFKEGGVVTTMPDVVLKPIESSRNVNHLFIRGMVDLLNDEIYYNCGLPKALISASGSELATSRTVAATYNSMHEGDRLDYEDVANKLINMQFAGKTWTAKTKTDGKEVTILYKFEDIKANFKLETLDTSNQLEEAQTLKTKAEGLVQIKNIGAGKEDLQALGEEAGFGLLALDGQPVQDPVGPNDPNAIPTDQNGNNKKKTTKDPTEAQAKAMLPFLKAMMAQVLSEEGIMSSSPNEPNIDDIVESTSKYIEKGYDDLIDEFSKMLHKKVSN